MKEKKNYIDNIPRINDMKWEVLEDGIVEITVENTGFYNKVAQRLFTVSYTHLTLPTILRV